MMLKYCLSTLFVGLQSEYWFKLTSTLVVYYEFRIEELDKRVEYDPKIFGTSKANKKFKTIKDWRKSNNTFTALFCWKIRPNDKHIYVSLLFAYLVIVLMGVAISIHKNSTEGVSWIMAFFAFYTSYSFLVRPFSWDTELRLFEIFMYSISILAVFGWGLIDFWIRFDFSPEEHNEGNFFLIWYCLFIPFVILCTTFLYRWYLKEWEFDGFVLTVMPLTLEWGIALLVCCYLFIGPISGSIFTGIVVIIIYAGFMVFIYYKNNGRLPRKWAILNFWILSLVAVSTFIVALSIESFVIFFGWSISYGVVILMVFLYGFSKFARDLWYCEQEPIFFSPWIFPIYKYNSIKNCVERRDKPTVYIFLALLLAFLWSFQCAAWMTPISIGIWVSCLVEVIVIIFVLYLVSFTPVMLHDADETLK